MKAAAAGERTFALDEQCACVLRARACAFVRARVGKVEASAAHMRPRLLPLSSRDQIALPRPLLRLRLADIVVAGLTWGRVRTMQASVISQE